jgi:6-phosphogluconolactonase (cycloisomerase 2 family)
MSFRRAARAAFAARSRAYWMLVVATLVLTALSISCGNSSHGSSSASHNGYVSFPNKGSVALLHFDDKGVITLGAQTPLVVGTTPEGLVLAPGKKFLYAGNAGPTGNSISIFNVAGDGTLTQNGDAIAIGASPRALAIDASGKYLLVTTNFVGTNLLVFSLDAGSGAITQIGSYSANTSPNYLTVSPSSNYVYVSNSDVNLITAFSLDSATGILTPIPGSPFPADLGVAGTTTDPNSRYLYAANNSANTVSGYTITATGVGAGALTPILGSPFSLGTASGPRAVATDTTGVFLYVANQVSNNVSAFTITSGTGALAQINSGTPYAAGTSPVFIMAEPAGQFLYVGNQGSTNITGYTYDSATGKLTAISGSPFSLGSAPGGIAIAH